jgi:hypothetical protein
LLRQVGFHRGVAREVPACSVGRTGRGGEEEESDFRRVQRSCQMVDLIHLRVDVLLFIHQARTEGEKNERREESKEKRRENRESRGTHKGKQTNIFRPESYCNTDMLVGGRLFIVIYFGAFSQTWQAVLYLVLRREGYL